MGSENKGLPLVSVVVSVYNGERFLKKTIDSILKQTYQNMEIIMVDDASTDLSRAIIDSYQDDRMKRLYLAQNHNVCVASNKGFAMANGDYIAICGHDDEWADDKIEKQVKYLESHEECGACFSKCNIIDQDDNIINQEHFLFRIFEFCMNKDRYVWIRDLLTCGNCLCAASAMMRTKLVKSLGGYREPLLQLQDYDLWLRILKESDIYVLDERLVCYRQILDTRTNLSAPKLETNRRSAHEIYFIQDRYLYTMPNELFGKIFKENFEYQEASSAEELLCERVFLEKKMNNPYFAWRMMDLLEGKETRDTLNDKYHFTLKDFYEMNGKSLFREPGLLDALKETENKAAQYKEIAEQALALLQKQQNI